MRWEPITESEFRLHLAAHVLRLDQELFPRWEALGVMPELIRCERLGTGEPIGRLEEVFVVARAGAEVLIYDDVEDEFGIGEIDSDGVLRSWSNCGEELAWAMRRFPSFDSSVGPVAPPA